MFSVFQSPSHNGEQPAERGGPQSVPRIPGSPTFPLDITEFSVNLCGFPPKEEWAGL